MFVVLNEHSEVPLKGFRVTLNNAKSSAIELNAK